MAAQNDNIKAMHNLAILYENKEENITEAKRWYQLAAEKEDPDAMNSLALFYNKYE